MNLIEINIGIKKERKRAKKLGASKDLLKRLEITSSYIAITVEQMKREGIDPEGGGM